VRTILLRNFAKRIGIYALLQDLKKKQKNHINCDFILWDEGILQSAHNLFVHANTVPNIQEIEYFKSLVPQPEIVVWIKASPEKSIQCTLTRGHKRVKKNIDLVKKFIDHACLVFDNLLSGPTIHTHLVIDNSHRHSLGKDNQSLEQQITQIVNLVKADREQVKC
jgi:deoxyadenosine/deoxycytidine kinase